MLKKHFCLNNIIVIITIINYFYNYQLKKIY